MNGYRHVELSDAVSGMGAVLQTANPRLFSEYLPISSGTPRISIFSSMSDSSRWWKHWHRNSAPSGSFIALTDRAHMPESAIPKLVCYEDLIGAEDDRFDWPEIDENAGLGALLHLGHHRQSEGRALFAPLDGAARHGRGLPDAFDFRRATW